MSNNDLYCNRCKSQHHPVECPSDNGEVILGIDPREEGYPRIGIGEKMKTKKAIITGLAGQDGSYMAELLHGKGYEILGVVRNRNSKNLWRLNPLAEKDPCGFRIAVGDVTDPIFIRKIVSEFQPSEIYHFAAQSFVGRSWESPLETMGVNLTGTMNVLEEARRANYEIRVLQASSSEMFGVSKSPQNETTKFNPQSPYAVSKVAAHHMAVNYRESYGVWVACSIAFNHESPRRGDSFVTKKIADAFKMALNRPKLSHVHLKLGNLNSRRDWGYAPDYVEAMWRMLQGDKPVDYVIGTGVSRSVSDFIAECRLVTGLDQKAVLVSQDETLKRPLDGFELRADASLIEKELRWRPSTGFSELVRKMIFDE